MMIWSIRRLPRAGGAHRPRCWRSATRAAHYTMADLRAAAECEIPRIIDRVGAGLPVRPLAVAAIGADGGDGSSNGGGLLHAIDRGGPSALAGIAAQLSDPEAPPVCCALGLGADEVYAQIMREGAAAWPFMRPGQVVRSTGSGGGGGGAQTTTMSGRSPSGAPRGDRYALLRELRARQPALQLDALTKADAALDAVSGALAHQLDAMMGMAADASRTAVPHRRAPSPLGVGQRSDLFVAIFPGDGVGYPSHMDGDDAGCRVTMILYTSTEHDAARHGGALRMLDEHAGCWHEVAPRADTLVLFRSDRVLHKVEPCRGGARRLALTSFLSDRRVRAQEEQFALLSSLAFTA